MTAQLSRERLEALANIQSLECMALPASHAESAEMARMLLAGMDSEPVYQFIYNNPYEEGYTEWLDCNYEYFKGVPDDCRRILYAALPAPVAVPECFRNAVSALESLYRNGQKQCWNERYTTDMAYASGVLNACRAAMLKGENHEQ